MGNNFFSKIINRKVRAEEPQEAVYKTTKCNTTFGLRIKLRFQEGFAATGKIFQASRFAHDCPINSISMLHFFSLGLRLRVIILCDCSRFASRAD